MAIKIISIFQYRFLNNSTIKAKNFKNFKKCWKFSQTFSIMGIKKPPDLIISLKSTSLMINKINFFYLFLKITVLWCQKMLYTSQSHSIMMIKKTRNSVFCQNHDTMVIKKISIFDFVLKITLLWWPKNS